MSCKCNKACRDPKLDRRDGRIEVTLSTVCADDDPQVKTFCLDVTEYPTRTSTECVENDHTDSSVPLDASCKQIEAYLTAALAAATGAYAVTRSVRRTAYNVDLAAACAIPGVSG